MPPPGKYACANVFPGPSKGLLSPCDRDAKLISISDRLVVSENVRPDTSLHIYEQFIIACYLLSANNSNIYS